MKYWILFLLIFSFFHSYSANSADLNYAQPESETLDEIKNDESPDENEISSLPIGQVYLKPEAGIVTVSDLDHPGATHDDCKKNPTWCVAWPDSSATINNLPFSAPVQKQTGINPKTGEPILETFVHVRIQYSRKGINVDKEGWLNTKYLSNEKLKSVIEEAPEEEPKTHEATPNCDNKKRSPVTKNQHEDLKNTAKKIKADNHKAIMSEIDALNDKIGRCPLKKPTDKSAYQEKWRKKNIYDQEVMPMLKEMKSEVPKIKKADGKMMTWADMVNIDALSRTIYAEMNSCFDDGLQYPMAAARVAINRVEQVDNGFNLMVFLKSWFHEPEKPTLAKVLTADRQFSVWNYMSGPKDKTILMSLCPTRDEKQASWMGNDPSNEELKIWKQAVQIATEAVLHPIDFKDKTSEVHQLYYTSGMSKYDGRTRPKVAPKIAGRAVSSYKCMYLWNGK